VHADSCFALAEQESDVAGPAHLLLVRSEREVEVGCGSCFSESSRLGFADALQAVKATGAVPFAGLERRVREHLGERAELDVAA